MDRNAKIVLYLVYNALLQLHFVLYAIKIKIDNLKLVVVYVVLDFLILLQTKVRIFVKHVIHYVLRVAIQLSAKAV